MTGKKKVNREKKVAEYSLGSRNLAATILRAKFINILEFGASWSE